MKFDFGFSKVQLDLTKFWYKINLLLLFFRSTFHLIMTSNLTFETIPFKALDGFECNLKHVIRETEPTKGPLLFVHGAGVRANIFNAPNKTNLIKEAVKAGYDVWLENWRASIDLPKNEWNLDIVARNDHPAAVRKIVELTGKKELKAIIHCQGSTSFMMSAILGLVPEVKTIISNAVSLHPIVPGFSVFKLNILIPIVKLMFKYLNPQWGRNAPDIKSKILQFIVALFHQENDTMVGKFVSFIYGSGFPALWELSNLNEETRLWIQDEFANVPLSFFSQIQQCVRKGVLTSVDGQNICYAPDVPGTDARVVLFGGEKNKCFKAESQQKTFDYLESKAPGKHKLYRLEKYSHLDVFYGKDAHKDVFPIMLEELEK